MGKALGKAQSRTVQRSESLAAPRGIAAPARGRVRSVSLALAKEMLDKCIHVLAVVVALPAEIMP